MSTASDRDELHEKRFCEIYDRLRETEAQTREQNTRLGALCDRIEAFSSVTDRFFELEDKRHQADDARFAELIEHEKRLSESSDKRYKDLVDIQSKREEKFWKIITVLLGSVIALSLGPKACMELYKAFKGDIGKVGYYNINPICPPQNNDPIGRLEYAEFGKFDNALKV